MTDPLDIPMPPHYREWYYPTRRELRAVAREVGFAMPEFAAALGFENSASLYNSDYPLLGWRSTRRALRVLSVEGSVSAERWFVPSPRQAYAEAQRVGMTENELAHALDMGNSQANAMSLRNTLGSERLALLRPVLRYYEEEGYVPMPGEVSRSGVRADV